MTYPLEALRLMPAAQTLAMEAAGRAHLERVKVLVPQPLSLLLQVGLKQRKLQIQSKTETLLQMVPALRMGMAAVGLEVTSWARRARRRLETVHQPPEQSLKFLSSR
jgi:hypothetical protein